MSAFFSYAHFDNDSADGKLVEFAKLLEREVQKQTGDLEFRVYIDWEQHGCGDDWRRFIACGIEKAAVFIPVLSPAYLKREGCQIEFDRFLEKQSRVLEHPSWDRSKRLILPLLYQEIRKDQRTDPH